MTSGEIPGTFTDGECGDIISETFEFNGDTLITYSIPYIFQTIYAECCTPGDPSDNAGYVAISIVNPVVCNTQTVSDSNVYVSMWTAIEPNGFEFHTPMPLQACNSSGVVKNIYPCTNYSLTGLTKVPQGVSDSDFMDELFLQKFPPLLAARETMYRLVCSPKKQRSFRELMKKSYAWTGPTAEGMLENPVVLSNGQQMISLCLTDLTELENPDPLILLSRYFSFYKGSLIYKFVSTSGTTTTVNTKKLYAGLMEAFYQDTNNTFTNPYLYTNRKGLNSAAVQDIRDGTGFEITIPFYNKKPFCATYFRNAFSISNIQNDYEEVQGFIECVTEDSTEGSIGLLPFYSCGDDFTMAWGMGCPVLYSGPSAAMTTNKPRNKRGSRTGSKPEFSLNYKKQTKPAGSSRMEHVLE